MLGLWAMRTPSEVDEVCRIYNLNPDIARKYVQFGEVFNLLHAGASYLRTWQKGYGAVGVSDKYGKRSFARKCFPVAALTSPNKFSLLSEEASLKGGLP